MTHIISIANHKGGVGKTTSSQNIGAALSKYGHRVLVVDLDPQANLSDAFGCDNPEVSIYDALKGEQPLPIVRITESLHIVPSALDLSVAETELNGVPGREYVLKELLEKRMGEYDYIVIDSPPSLGLLTVNALTASTALFIPVDSQYFAIKGLDKLQYVVAQVRKRLNRDIDISGVFLTMFDSRIVLGRQMLELLETYFPGKVFSTKIRRNVSLVEAPIQNQDIFSYAPESNGAQDYLELAKEIHESLAHRHNPLYHHE